MRSSLSIYHIADVLNGAREPARADSSAGPSGCKLTQSNTDATTYYFV